MLTYRYSYNNSNDIKHIIITDFSWRIWTLNFLLIQSALVGRLELWYPVVGDDDAGWDPVPLGTQHWEALPATQGGSQVNILLSIYKLLFLSIFIPFSRSICMAIFLHIYLLFSFFFLSINLYIKISISKNVHTIKYPRDIFLHM